MKTISIAIAGFLTLAPLFSHAEYENPYGWGESQARFTKRLDLNFMNYGDDVIIIHHDHASKAFFGNYAPKIASRHSAPTCVVDQTSYENLTVDLTGEEAKSARHVTAEDTQLESANKVAFQAGENVRVYSFVQYNGSDGETIKGARAHVISTLLADDGHPCIESDWDGGELVNPMPKDFLSKICFKAKVRDIALDCTKNYGKDEMFFADVMQALKGFIDPR